MGGLGPFGVRVSAQADVDTGLRLCSLDLLNFKSVCSLLLFKDVGQETFLL